MRNHKRNIGIVITALFILVIPSCIRSFYMSAEGHLGGQIIFYFYASMQRDVSTKLNITEFFVQEKVTDSEWKTIWHLSGSAKLDSIVYGDKYDGLEEKIPAKSLIKKVDYRAIAYDLPIMKPQGIAGVEFFFDQSGAIVVKEYNKNRLDEKTNGASP